MAPKVFCRAGVLIFTHKHDMDPIEEINFRQCCSVLDKHPILLVCPQTLQVDRYTSAYSRLKILRIPDQALASLQAYNRTKVSSWFYDLLKDFEFVLTYELDAFVFRDELIDWCREGYDYIGAPWFDGYGNADSISNALPGGNSGFSLRNVRQCRRVLRTFQTVRPFSEVYEHWRRCFTPSLRAYYALLRLSILDNMFHARFNGFWDNEDLFWSKYAGSKLRWFRVAPFDAASKFSFETLPHLLYEFQGRRLPFGCHKWNVYGESFWRPHIEQFGHRW